MSLLRYLRSRRQPCFKKAHYRRNGWDVKPRHGKDPNALIVEDKWWHDSSKSVYWQYFKDDTSFNERTIQFVEFYDEFHMPRAVFRDFYNMFHGMPGFKDKKRGDGGRGMRTQPDGDRSSRAAGKTHTGQAFLACGLPCFWNFVVVRRVCFFGVRVENENDGLGRQNFI